MKRLIFVFLVLCLSISACFPIAAKASEAEAVPFEEWDSYIDRYADDTIGISTTGAAVIVLKDGETVISKNYGYGNRETALAVDSDTVFEWASDSKLLVWVSVMQLVEQGKLDLGRDIREYLPDGFLRQLRYDEEITLYHLMNHLAGWEEALIGTALADPGEVYDLGRYLQDIEPAQTYRPGELVCYSNYGTALAGYIVELVSGLPYYEYVNQHIFSVLEMENTTVHPTQADKPFLSERRDQISGYVIDQGGKLAPSQTRRVYWGMYPAAAAIGTAEDAAKFVAALTPPEGEAGPLFESGEMMNQMTSTSYFYNESYPGIAHGFWEMKYSGRNALRHTGGSDGFTSCFTIIPEERLGLIAMTNQFEESNFTRNLPLALLGEFRPDSPEKMPSSAALEGFYIRARRPVTGFARIYGFLMNTVKVSAVDENVILVSGVRFSQISPYVYERAGELDRELYSIHDLYFEMEEGKVKRVAASLSDFTPLSRFEIAKYVLSVAVLGAAVLYALVSSVILVLRRNAALPRYLKVAHAASHLCIVVFIINLTCMAMMALRYASPAALRPFLWGSRVCMLLLALSAIILLIKSIALHVTGKTKAHLRISGAVSGLFLVSAVWLQLYL